MMESDSLRSRWNGFDGFLSMLVVDPASSVARRGCRCECEFCGSRGLVVVVVDWSWQLKQSTTPGRVYLYLCDSARVSKRVAGGPIDELYTSGKAVKAGAMLAVQV